MNFKQIIGALFLFSCFFSNNVSAKTTYNVSVAAIFQDEAQFLKEWIEYYKILGVEHFYLYNNLSHDNYAEVLAPYVASGDVELIEWPYQANNLGEWDQIQINSYKDAVKRSKETSKWLAIIDVDEFIVPIKAKSLSKLLLPYESNKNIGGVCITWVCFGTSNYYQLPTDRLMIESLVLNAGPSGGGDLKRVRLQGAFKTIVRPKYVSDAVSPHYCEYLQGRKHAMMELSNAQINHYWTRDEKFLIDVKIPRREVWGQNVDSVMEWANGLKYETPEGKPILRFVPELRKRMGL